MRFPEWIGDFWIVQVPGLFAEVGAGVTLPGGDAELLDLAFHLLQLRLAEIGPQQAVRKDTLRVGQAVDIIARACHLIGRQRIARPIACRHAADDRHHRVAVAENLFDVMDAIEQVEAPLQILGLRPQQSEETGVALPSGVSYHLRLTST